MSSKPPVDEKDVFNAARKIADAEAREQYLESVCGDDQQALQRVRDLLSVHETKETFLESPPVGIEATQLSELTEKSGDTIGPYKLLQQLGEGGMGVVYLAEQSQPVQRRVAVKIIKPGMDTRQVIARFEAERQALAIMDHPNIARVFDAGATDAGRPYFVMELVKGVPITQYCDEHRLDPRQRLELFKDVCHGIQHAHQKGVIHRDLKPSNVLVAEFDDQPVPKIIDFGVAKATQHRLTNKTMFTEVGTVVGTIEYMSPEQAKLNQSDIDTRSDIYSMGVLLYELLTGETPFDRKKLRSAALDEMLRIIREEEPSRPSLKLSTSDSLPSIAANRKIEPKRLSTLVRGELDWIVMKALEKDRARRYDTANAFADDIGNYLNNEAVVACPPTAGYRFRKFARRNKAVLATIGMVSAALILGLVGTSWQAIRATQSAVAERIARDEADKARQAEATQLAIATTERDRARTNLEVADSERQRAESNLDLAFSALDEVYLGAIGEDRLLGPPVSQQMPNDSVLAAKVDQHFFTAREKELLRRGLEFYERFAQQNAGTNAAAAQSAEAYRRVGLMQSALGDHPAAESAFSQAISQLTALITKEPDHFRHFERLAAAYLGYGTSSTRWPDAQEALQQARKALSRAIELRPDEAWLYLKRARISELLDDRHLRSQDLNKALEIDPNDVHTLQACSTLYQHGLPNQVDLQKSRELAERAVALAPDDPAAHERLASVLGWSENAGSSPLLGIFRVIAEDREGALEHFTRAIELAPSQAAFVRSRGTFLSHIGEFDRALEDLNRALELNPQDWHALRARAAVRFARADLDAALLDLRASVQLRPHDEKSYRQMAEVHLKKENWEEAAAVCTRAIEIAPSNFWLYKRRARALFELGRFDESLADLQKTFELNPNDASIHVWIGAERVANCQDKEFQDGILKLANQVVDRNRTGFTLYGRALLSLSMGRRDQAVADYEEAIKLDPEREALGRFASGAKLLNLADTVEQDTEEN